MLGGGGLTGGRGWGVDGGGGVLSWNEVGVRGGKCVVRKGYRIPRDTNCHLLHMVMLLSI